MSLVFVISVVLSTTGVYGQTDCRPHKDYPELKGHWKDDLNGQDVDISSAQDVDKRSITHVTAAYSTPDKSCRDPDRNGNPVAFQTDFVGLVGERNEVQGDIYWCDTSTSKGKTYTTGISHGQIVLSESKDGKKLDGDFYGHNGKEHISFTRTSKLPDYGQVVLKLDAGTKIYGEASDTSQVLWNPAAGTRVIAEDAVHDPQGNATWYFVTNYAGRAVRENSGWIQASQVKCPGPPPGPVSIIWF